MVERLPCGDRGALETRHRSKVTNRRDLLPNVRDGRTATARRFKDITLAVAADQRGINELSEARLQLIRRFSALCCHAELLEARLANGEQVDIGEHSNLSSTLVRIASRIGIDRIPKDVTPSLGEYLKRRRETDDETLEAAE
jgi:hypothetical protein